MAHLTSKDQGFKLDGAAQTLVDLGGSVNSQSLSRAFTILDDSGMGDAEHTNLYGMRQAPRIPLNGWVNSTVDGVLGPLLAGGTSVTKTAEFKQSASRFYNGEFLVSNVQYSGSPDTLQTWSCELVGSATLNRTSKALS